MYQLLLDLIGQFLQLRVALVNFLPDLLDWCLGIPDQHIPIIKLYLVAGVVPVLYEVQTDIPDHLTHHPTSDVVPGQSRLCATVLLRIEVFDTHDVLSPDVVVVDPGVHVVVVVV